MRHFSQRIFQCLVVATLLFMAAADAQAQLGGLKKKLPGVGGGSSGGNADLESILNTIDGARLKFAYARISLSIADDVIRRQALRNSAKKSTGGQIDKDKKEIEALDKSMEVRQGGDSFDWFLQAMVHWQLGDKSAARRWYDRAVEQMLKNRSQDQDQEEELKLLRAEVEGILKQDPV